MHLRLCLSVVLMTWHEEHIYVDPHDSPSFYWLFRFCSSAEFRLMFSQKARFEEFFFGIRRVFLLATQHYSQVSFNT